MSVSTQILNPDDLAKAKEGWAEVVAGLGRAPEALVFWGLMGAAKRGSERRRLEGDTFYRIEEVEAVALHLDPTRHVYQVQIHQAMTLGGALPSARLRFGGQGKRVIADVDLSIVPTGPEVTWQTVGEAGPAYVLAPVEGVVQVSTAPTGETYVAIDGVVIAKTRPEHPSRGLLCYSGRRVTTKDAILLAFPEYPVDAAVVDQGKLQVTQPTAAGVLDLRDTLVREMIVLATQKIDLLVDGQHPTFPDLPQAAVSVTVGYLGSIATYLAENASQLPPVVLRAMVEVMGTHPVEEAIAVAAEGKILQDVEGWKRIVAPNGEASLPIPGDAEIVEGLLQWGPSSAMVNSVEDWYRLAGESQALATKAVLAALHWILREPVRGQYVLPAKALPADLPCNPAHRWIYLPQGGMERGMYLLPLLPAMQASFSPPEGVMLDATCLHFHIPPQLKQETDGRDPRQGKKGKNRQGRRDRHQATETA
jgi:hypothetical protein